MTTNCIGYPIRYPIGSHRVDPNRGRIPRPDPSRPVPLTTGASAPIHRCSLYRAGLATSVTRARPAIPTMDGLASSAVSRG